MTRDQTHLAAEYEAQQQRDGELRVAEEDDEQQVRVSRRLQEQPGTQTQTLHISLTSL